MNNELQEELLQDASAIKLNHTIIMQSKALASFLNDDRNLLIDDEINVSILENTISKAVNFYYSHITEEAKTVDLLKYIEEIIISSLDSRLESLQISLAKNNTDTSKLINKTVMVSSFEASVMQSIIKEMYCRDEKMKEKYQEIRSTIRKKLDNHFQQETSMVYVDLIEEKNKSENHLNILNLDSNKLMRQYNELQQKYTTIIDNFNETKSMYNQAISALKSYHTLAQWYEKQLKETPAIKKKNSGLIREQTWEAALNEFENCKPKPSTPSINFK